MAEALIASCGSGSAMVLPEGADPAAFRYPRFTHRYACGVCLAAFAYGMTREQQHALGHALIAAGIDAVHVLGGSEGLLEFRAT
jgi:hypothetical protein